MQKLWAVACLWALAVQGRTEDLEREVIRYYPATPHLFAYAWTNKPPVTGIVDVRDFFSRHGVKWTEDGFAEFHFKSSMICVRNSENNLKDLERLLAILDVLPKMVQVTVEVLDYRGTELGSLADPSFGKAEDTFRREGKLQTVMKLSTTSETGSAGILSTSYPPVGGTNIVERFAKLSVFPVVAADGYTVSLTLNGLLVVPEQAGRPATKHEIQSVLTIWDGQVMRMCLDEERNKESTQRAEKTACRYLRLQVNLLDPAGHPIAISREPAQERPLEKKTQE